MEPTHTGRGMAHFLEQVQAAKAGHGFRKEGLSGEAKHQEAS